MKKCLLFISELINRFAIAHYTLGHNVTIVIPSTVTGTFGTMRVLVEAVLQSKHAPVLHAETAHQILIDSTTPRPYRSLSPTQIVYQFASLFFFCF